LAGTYPLSPLTELIQNSVPPRGSTSSHVGWPTRPEKLGLGRVISYGGAESRPPTDTTSYLGSSGDGGAIQNSTSSCDHATMSAAGTGSPFTSSSPHPSSPSQNELPSAYTFALAFWIVVPSIATLDSDGASYWNKNAFDSYASADSDPSAGSAPSTSSTTAASAPNPGGTENSNRSSDSGLPSSSTCSSTTAGDAPRLRDHAKAACAVAGTPPPPVTRIDDTVVPLAGSPF